ncbi:MAG: hypothetical protein KDE51_28090 [Anaerolineales bacterium]|nr:hypothetical protein [Anaerolineales bacterium]
MSKQTFLFLTLLLFTVGWFTTASMTQAATDPPSPLLNYDASADSDGNSTWEDTVGTEAGFDIALSANVTRNAAVTAIANITHAYTFPGGGSINNNENGGTMTSLQNVTGDPSNDTSVSFEMWFKPAGLANGDQVLFEDGGGTGTALTLNNNILTLSHIEGGTQVQSTYDITSIAGEFIQVVGTYEFETSTTTLYVNGQIADADNSADDAGDWTGGDDVGIGTRGGANMGGFGNGSQGKVTFTGDVAIFRFYETLLDGLDVAELYANVTAATMNYPTAGNTLHFDASTDTDADSDWENTSGVLPAYRLVLDTANGVTRSAVTSGYTGITHAYNFPGGVMSNANGALLNDGGADVSLNGLTTGDPTISPASFEVWFKPTNLTGGLQVLFEDGGGTGIGLFLENSTLRARHIQGGNASEVTTDITAIAGEFIQAVMTYDPVTNGVTLYVNGALIGSDASGNLTDWTGGDAAGIGTRGGANMGGYGGGSLGVSSFDG